jgi:hypothetical protein
MPRSARFVVVRWMSNRRVVNVQSLIATGVNVDGHRKIVGLESSRPKMAWDGWPAADSAHGDEKRSPATNLVALVLCTVLGVEYCPLVVGLFIGWRHDQWRCLLLRLSAECAPACMSP